MCLSPMFLSLPASLFKSNEKVSSSEDKNFLKIKKNSTEHTWHSSLHLNIIFHCRAGVGKMQNKPEMSRCARK